MKKPYKNNKISFFAIGLISFFLTSCLYKHDTPSPNCVSSDINNIISYNNDIEPILKTNCIECHAAHSGSDGVVLDNYAGVRLSVETNRLYESIKIRDNGTPEMPRGGRLSDCQIATIKLWIDQGIKQN